MEMQAVNNVINKVMLITLIGSIGIMVKDETEWTTHYSGIKKLKNSRHDSLNEGIRRIQTFISS